MRFNFRPSRKSSRRNRTVLPIVALAVFGLIVALSDRLSENSLPDDEIAIFHSDIEGNIDTQVAGINFRRCGAPPHYNCVIDGDTFYYHDQSIRIAGIDAPEINPPECNREYELGEEASLRLIQLLNGGPFEIEYVNGEDEDQYGRKLRTLSRDGSAFGDILQEEGLARRWAGRHLSWCE